MITPLRQVASAHRISETVESIRAVQLQNGMIPWFDGGHADPWNHVEAAMALTVGGAREAAERAYEWLRATQRPDGSWHTYYLANGQIEEPRLDTNVCAYVATGVWHHFLATGDSGFLEDLWPLIERAIDFVVAWQRPGGELVWSVDPDGTPGRYGLLTGSSSAYFSLRCAIACAEQLGHEHPDWELAAGRLRHAVAFGADGFASKDEFAMDWYYPVLVGALDIETASDRLDERWSEFVIEHRGVRCVSNRAWVTAAETAECAMALLSIGRREQASTLLGWVQQQRCPDGSYTTGVVYPEKSTYPPSERSTYTAAAIVLAVDALTTLSPAARLFVGGTLPRGLDLDSEALEDLA
ncbi:MAG TPA: hypothetical protein VK217_07640 [Acidimicrobiales bacterium]|nr:hypothetical protein [Acidimicrobiales bacterium]